jgi:hypothetical protein
MFKQRLTIVRQISRCRKTKIEKEIKNETMKIRSMTNKKRKIVEKTSMKKTKTRESFLFHLL